MMASRFNPSAVLEADLAHWLSAYTSLLEKHKEEISRDLDDWRDYARRKFNLIQPCKPSGRIPDEKVTRATELKVQRMPWSVIYARTGTKGWPAQQRLREAVRARHRRHKKRTNQQVGS